MVEEKKRILIFSHAMELGGVERVLIGLLEAINKEQYTVDLFLMRHSGELLKDIPSHIHLLPEIPQYASLAVPIKQVLRKKQFAVALGRLYGKRRAKKRKAELGINGESELGLEYSHKYTKLFMPRIGTGCYDLAISFLTPHYFVRDKVRAKKKIAWIHTDYSKVAVDRESQLTMWSAYDYIVSISDKVSRSFDKIFPELHDKIITMSHCIPVDYIRNKAGDNNPFGTAQSRDCVNILSVGRFTNAKNFDQIPDICRRIRERDININWYLIGYGGDETLIRRKIAEADMKEYVKILGKKANPYPYIRACDLYVQPSRYEGKCVSVIEAQILGKPVVITDYPTASSQLEDGVDGVIVPMDNEGCAGGIAELLQNPAKMSRISTNCLKRDYSNAGEIEKLYVLMERDENNKNDYLP